MGMTERAAWFHDETEVRQSVSEWGRKQGSKKLNTSVRFVQQRYLLAFLLACTPTYSLKARWRQLRAEQPNLHVLEVEWSKEVRW